MSENLFVIIGMIFFGIIFLYISPRGRSKKLDFMYPKAFRMAQEVFREKVVFKLGALNKRQMDDIEEYVIARQFERDRDYYLDTKIQYKVFDTALDWLMQQTKWLTHKNDNGVEVFTEKGKGIVESINNLLAAPTTLTGIDQETRDWVKTSLLELLPKGLLDTYSELKPNAPIIEPATKKQKKATITDEQAQQYLGMDIITSKTGGFNELFVGKNFACFSTQINNRQAIVFSKTYMYPAKYEDLILDEEDKFIKYLSKLDADLVHGSDVYMVGVGAIRKIAETDKEKGEFIPGEKYLLYLGNIKQIQCAKNDSLGFCINNPILLSSVSDEYYLLEQLRYTPGIIISHDRECSLYKDDEAQNPLDKWIVVVEDAQNIRYEYSLYLDPYAISRPNRPRIHGLVLPFNFVCE